MSDWIINDDGIRIPHVASTPSAPVAGSTQLYADATGIYMKDSSGFANMLGMSAIEIAHCVYREPTGIAGDTFASGAVVRVATLDEILVDQDWLNLIANEFTLTAGTYLIIIKMRLTGTVWSAGLAQSGVWVSHSETGNGDTIIHNAIVEVASSETYHIGVNTWQTYTQTNNGAHLTAELYNHYSDLVVMKIA